jgi:hypothetical protein
MVSTDGLSVELMWLTSHLHVNTVMRASVKEKLYTFENSAKLFKEAKVVL